MTVSRTRLCLAAICAAVLLVILGLAACAGSSGKDAPADSLGMTAGEPGFAGDFPALDQLTQMRQGAYTLLDLNRSGAEFEAGQPSSGVSAAGSDLTFTPSGTALGGCAYAIYAFALEGYDRDPRLHYSWTTAPPLLSPAYFGLSNWQTGRWDWIAGDATGNMDLGDMAPYINPSSPGLFYVAVVVPGTDVSTLASLSIGSNLPADTLYIEPAQASADPGDEVTLTVLCSGSLHPFHSLEAVRVVLPQYNSYVPGSLNAGAAGGLPTEPDGVWATVNPLNITLTPDAAIQPVDLGNGLIAYDFFVRPTGGSDQVDLSGALFNFRIAVFTDVTLGLQRSDGSSDRTFYHDFANNVHYWTYDDNAGGPGITLTGNALPVAALSADLRVGNPSMLVNFDASASTDTMPGSIVNYSFDFGDGSPVLDNGNNPLAQYTYTTNGKFLATVTVTDNEGGQGTSADLSIYCGYYDEVENNDTRPTGNNIPVLPVADFNGSIGDSTEIPVYDGDIQDFYNFACSAGDVLYVRCSFPQGDTDIQLNLTKLSGGTNLATSELDGKSPQTIRYTVAAGDSPLSLAVVGVSGAADYSLDISLNPPTADLTATPDLGDPPMQVTFNGGGSWDKSPGSIVKYEFDFGEGAGFEDFQGNFIQMHTYNSDGTYFAKLRVTDDTGLTDTAQHTVKVGSPYNEVEDNDDHTGANAVTFPMSNWVGSLGDEAPTYVGYDGDDRDFIKFSATAGQKINFFITGDSDTADIDVHLEDFDGNILAESTSPEADENFSYTFTVDGDYFVYIELWYSGTQDGYSDYAVNATLL